MEVTHNPEEIFNDLVKQIKSIIFTARRKVNNAVNNELLQAYWNVGKQIVEQEQQGNLRASYGSQLLVKLSKELTKIMGKGFSRSNLQSMRNFYAMYRNYQTVSGKLSWSHYCELLLIDDQAKRSFYEQESINSNWSVRELKRQMNTSLFERLLLSEGKGNKEEVVKLSREGQVLRKASDMMKNPYVFEFLGIPESKPILERDLEAKLIRHIEDFLLELGKGFMYVGSQQRITLGNEHYYVDMVFYNKILKAYILIDLKSRKLKHIDVGQMNTYLNYYKTEINEETDSDPIGIILCTEKSEIEAQYALGGLTNQVFASKYIYHLPDKELLIEQVEEVIKKKN